MTSQPTWSGFPAKPAMHVPPQDQQDFCRLVARLETLQASTTEQQSARAELLEKLRQYDLALPGSARR